MPFSLRFPGHLDRDVAYDAFRRACVWFGWADGSGRLAIRCIGFLFVVFAVVVLAGKFFTGSYLWELEPPNLRQFIPVRSWLLGRLGWRAFARLREGPAAHACARLWFAIPRPRARTRARAARERMLQKC